MSRQDFLRVPVSDVPVNYVAGLGRGATGFTTRSDIGPAREGPSEDGGKLPADGQQGGDDEQFKDAENDFGLFAKGSYDDEDREADRVYDMIDSKMELRRKAKREARERVEREKYELANPKLQQQFADLKRPLAAISDDEWAMLPEVGDLTGKNRRTKAETVKRTYAVPDSILAGANDRLQHSASIDDDGADADDDSRTDFLKLTRARQTLLGTQLDRVADTKLSSDAKAEANGYLSSLDSAEIKSETEVGDIKRGRTLLKSLTTTNPKNVNGWVSYARLEEHSGDIVQARKLIAKACDINPRYEDVWLENMRLNDTGNAKVIAGKAVKQVSTSFKVWLAAMRLETEPRAKKRVLQKAIDEIPQSVALWKELVSLQTDPEDARVLLAKAVEVNPMVVDLWLALARLEPYETARKALNKARQTIRKSYEIWIAAAKLQEEHLDFEGVTKTIERAIEELDNENVELSRQKWLSLAEDCESEGAIHTCRAILRATLRREILEDERLKVYLEDAKAAESRGALETAREIYTQATQSFPKDATVWRRASEFEKLHGSLANLHSILHTAEEQCPQAAGLWLMHARETWAGGDVIGARKILENAFQCNPNNEEIWLAAFNLEAQNGEYAAAKVLMVNARQRAPTERVWIRSVTFARQMQDTEEVVLLLNEALQMYPSSCKLWMMKGQFYQDQGDINGARQAFSQGTKASPHSPTLWILASRLEEKAEMVVKSRSILDKARLANPKSEELWLEAVRLEKRQGNTSLAKNTVSKALRDHPASGRLRSESIWMEPRTKRKTLFVDAYKNTNGDPTVIVSIARTMWAERKFDKAKAWFERAIEADPDNGDSWAWMYKFYAKQESDVEIEALVSRCAAASPHHGELWAGAAKDIHNWKKGTADILTMVAGRMQDGIL